MSNRFLAVVVPIGPGRTGLTALSSLQGQNNISELIVVLDGGIIHPGISFGAFPYPVRIIQSRMHGASSARNEGAFLAGNVKNYLFLDDDDQLLKDSLPLVQSFIIEKCDYVAWGFPAKIMSRNLVLKSHRQSSSEVRFDHLARRNVIGGCSSVIISRCNFEKAGGFDPLFESMQDWDMYLRLAQFGPIARSEIPLVCYDDIGTNRISSDPNKKRAGLIRLLEKHRRLFNDRTIAFHETRIRYYDCITGVLHWSALLASPDKVAGVWYAFSYLRSRVSR